MRPHDIAFDSKGNAYVSGRDNNNIQKFTHNGTFLLKWGTKGSGDGQFSIPYSIGIDGLIMCSWLIERIPVFKNLILMAHLSTNGME